MYVCMHACMHVCIYICMYQLHCPARRKPQALAVPDPRVCVGEGNGVRHILPLLSRDVEPLLRLTAANEILKGHDLVNLSNICKKGTDFLRFFLPASIPHHVAQPLGAEVCPVQIPLNAREGLVQGHLAGPRPTCWHARHTRHRSCRWCIQQEDSVQ